MTAYWLKLLSRVFKINRRVRVPDPYLSLRFRPCIEGLENRVTPSSGLQPGGVVHLPFTAGVVEGTAGATVQSGNPLVNPTLLDFTDTGATATTGDYSVTITWGDGTSDTFLSTSAAAPALVTRTGTTTSFHVVPRGDTIGAHIYEEAANGNLFTVRVTDVASAATTGPISTPFTLSINVADGALTYGGAASNFSAQEGAGFVNPIATFTDADPIGTISDFTATIHWGDGTTSAGTVTQPGGTGTAFSISGSHTYLEEATNNITVDIVDVGGSQLLGQTGPVATATEVQLTNVTGANTTQTSNEGSATTAITGIATFTDPAGAEPNPADPGGTPDTHYTTTINWGDGSTSPGTVVNTGGNNFRVDAPTHVYGEEGTYTVTVTVQHETAAALTTGTAATITVNEVQLTNLTGSGAAQTFSEGGTTTAITGIATFTDPAGAEPNPADPGGTPDTHYTTTINWGDGSTSPGTVVNTGGNNFRVDAPTHTYGEEGTFNITVTVQHETAAALTVTGTTITVSEVQITNLTPGAGTQTISEGGTTTAITGVATFTDPAGAEPNASDPGGTANTHYSTTINWGDGTTSAGNVVNTGGNNFRVDAPTHVYGEEGTFTITVTVQHETAAPLTSATVATITVSEVQLTNFVVSGAPSPAPAEGAVNGPITVATFTDPAGAEPNASDPGPIGNHYTATIDWGDGTGVHAGTVVNTGGNNFAIQDGTHTFVEEGTNNLTVTVTHEGAATLTGTQSYTVADQQITTPVVSSPSNVLEGAPTSANFNIATFTDPAGVGVETTADFTATIDWGDTATSAGTVVSDGGANYHVNAPAHTYAEEGTYTITVTVKHDLLAALSGTASVTVADQQITTPVAANLPTNGLEGAALGPITGIATFTDPAGIGVETPAGDFTATINWGDTTTSAGTVVSTGGGNYRVDAPGHTYVEEGTYTVAVTVKHDALAAVTSNGQTITIADQQITTPVVTAPGNVVEGGATTANFNIATFTDPAGVGVETPAGDFTATITWGDTTTSAGTVVSDGGGNYHVTAPAHTYVEEGTYTITVSVKHDSLAAVTSAGATITVSEVQLTNFVVSGAPSPAPTEGTVSGPITVATFTDPAGAEPNASDPGPIANHYTATIDWGDGTGVHAGTVVNTGGNNFAIQDGTHTFVEEGIHNLTVTVTHETAATLTGTQSYTVTDPAVVATPGATINGTEGASTNSVTLATFTDPGGAEALSEYSADVNWGDGTPLDTTAFILTNGTQFFVFGTHLYTEESPAAGFAITTTIHHASEVAPNPVNTVVTGQTARIADPQLNNLASANLPATGNEGVAIGPITGIATFSDPSGISEPVADYTATINWGDSTTSPGTVVDLGNGNFRVDAPAHTYAEEGAYTVNVTLKHDLLAAVTTPNQSITVDDQQITTPSVVGLPATGNEGASLGAITGLATFSDPAGAEPVGDYTATINWGDNTSSTGTVVNTGGNNFRVDAPAHTYVEEGNYSVTVTVKHDSLAAVTSAAASIAIADQQISTPVAANLPASGLEGASLGVILGIATFDDPAGTGLETAGDFTATIDWGDTTTSTGTVASLGGGNYRVDAPAHTYVEEGNYTVTVTVKHDALAAVTSNSLSIAIADQQLTNLTSSNVPPTGQEGAQIAAFQGIATFTDPAGVGVETPAGDFTATINWGDTTTSPGTIVSLGGGSYRVDAPAHTYVEEGTYTVNVTLKHDALATVTTPNQTITVADQQITTPVAANLPATGQENVALAAITGIATFTDPAGIGNETTADFTATINWGDGTTSPGTVASTGGGHYRVDAPAHTYVDEGTYSVTVTVKHDQLAAVTSNTQSITVADQQITTPVVTAPSNVLEGAATAANFNIATFNDPAGVGVETAAGDFTATIAWGDGNTSTGTVVSDGGGNYHVNAPAHTYAEEGTYTITVTVQHDKLAPVSGTAPVTVADQQITTPVAAVPANGQEGAAIGPITGIATFVDPAGVGLETPAGDFTATIAWGDTTTSTGTVVSLGAGKYRVDAPSHTYVEEGNFTVTVTVTHDALAALTSNSQSITIADQQITIPVVTAPSNVLEGAATSANFNIATFTDPAGVGVETATGDFTALIAWGDTTTSTGTVVSDGNGNYHVTAPTHTYAEEGNFTITVTVKHDQLAAVSGTAQVTVADQQITTPVVTAPSNVLEGAATPANFNIANLTDPAGVGAETPAGDFTAMIAWGDTATSAGTVVSDGGGHYHVNAPAHTYAEEGTYTITVTVKHDLLAAVSGTASVTVADQQITTPVAANLPANGLENAALAPITGIATFTDPAGVGLETPGGDFTATINWGDSTTSAGTVVSTGGGNYRVDAPGHSYVEEGTYTVTVTVKHDALAAVTSNSLTITIADQQITTPVVTTPGNILEGSSTTANFNIATFTDPAGVGVETVGDFTATINWGDGTTLSTGTVVSDGAGNYHVTAPAHTYAEEGTYTITVTVKHDLLAAVSGTASTPITVSDQQITTPVAANLPANGQEGAALGPITSIATFTDPAGVGLETPAGDFTATINWGDGTTAPGTVVSMGSGNYRVDAPGHTYVEEGTYTVTVTVKHDALAALTSNNQSITIADQQITTPVVTVPSNLLEGAATTANASIATFTDPAGVGLETPGGDFTATIAWGDTTTSPGTVVSDGNGNYHVTAAAHTYAEEGTFTITVTVQHDLLGAVSGTAPTTVADQQITTPLGANLPATGQEGASVGAITGIATFTDPAGVGLETPAGDFTATINWGDATTSPGTVVSTGGGNYRVDAPGHTYAEEGVYSVTVTVKHDLLPPVTSSTQIITIADQQITTPVVTPPSNVHEGTATAANLNIATFTDPAGVGVETPAGDFTATIAWGDGATSTGTVVSDGGVNYHVNAPAHTYADEGPFTVTVTVKHDQLAAVSGTGAITISEGDTLTPGTANISAVEGTAFNGQVATFTDTNLTNVAGDFTANINWGDGTTTTGTGSGANGQFAVSGNHTYAEEGSYNVSVTLADDSPGTATATATGTATVSDPAVKVTTFNLPFQAGVIQGTLLLGTFTDPGGMEQPNSSHYRVDVGWGDMLGDQGMVVYDTQHSVYDVYGSHTYIHEGYYNITLTVHHEGAPDAASAATQSVADAPLFLTSSSPPPAGTTSFFGQVATFTDYDVTGVASNYVATITWGDGTTSSGTITFIGYGYYNHPNFAVTASHTYGSAPTSPFKIQITDVSGGTTTYKSNDGSAAVTITWYFDVASGTYKMFMYTY
jgi:PKD repeat protein